MSNVLRQAVGKLRSIKKLIAKNVEREEKLKDGQQALELSPAAFFMGLKMGSDAINRIHQQVPESVNMSRLVISQHISQTSIKFFARYRKTRQRINEATPGLIDATPRSGFREKHYALLANNTGTLYSWITAFRESLVTETDISSRIARAYVSSGSDMHFGHLQGPAVEKTLDIQKKYNNANRSIQKNFAKQGVSLRSGMAPVLVGQGTTIIDKAIELDARINFNKSLTAKYGITSNMEVWFGVFEAATANTQSGAATKNKIRQLSPIIDHLAESLIEYIDIIETHTSKSTVDLMDDAFTAAFMDKNSKVYKSKSKQSSKTPILKTKIKIKSHRLAPAAGAIKKSKIVLPDYLKLQRQINASLHDTLKYDVMGKGTATQLLNYRTGRFAESVKVTKIIPPVGKLRQHTINVRYMSNPYIVFSPGGYLYKPLRDPERLAGRAIRKIIKDEAISELSSHKTRVAY